MEQSCRRECRLSASAQPPHTHFNQSDVVVKIQRIVGRVIVELRNVKDLFGVLRLAQGVEPQDHLSPVGPEKSPHR